MGGWRAGPIAVYDCETTGVDVDHDRIVTAYAAHIHNGQVSPRNWLADPGIEIPEGAARIHGVTTDHARNHGLPAADVVDEVTNYLVAELAAGVPVIGQNIVYDLTLLDRECVRHGLATLEDRLGRPVSPIIDVRVIDRNMDRYRKGSRKLEDLAKHYGVRHDGAHNAGEDALAAGRIAYVIAGKYPEIGEASLDDLHTWQVQWAAEQTASLAEYRRKIGKPLDDEDGTWPIRPRSSPENEEST